MIIRKIYTYLILSLCICSLSAQTEKKVLIEVGTGTWCGACPKAQVYEKELASNYPDQYVFIKSHYGDEMEYSEYVSGLSLGAIPSGWIDRDYISWLGPFDDIYDDMSIPFTESPAAGIEVTVDYDPSTRQMDVSIEAEVLEDLYGDYRLAAVVMEDAVSGTTISYDQSNAYSGDSDPMGGFELLPPNISAYNMAYNNVARHLLGGIQGDIASLPNNLVAGQNYSYSYSYTLPEAYDESYVNVAAYMLDVNNDLVINADETNYLSGESNAVPFFNERPPLSAIKFSNCNFRIAAHDPDYEDLSITLLSTLPVGLSFNDNGDGFADIGGAPQEHGEFEIILSATDGNWTVEETFYLSISDAESDWIQIGIENTNLLSRHNEIEINEAGTKFVLSVDPYMEQGAIFVCEDEIWSPLSATLPCYTFYADISLDLDGNPLYFAKGNVFKWNGDNWDQLGTTLPDIEIRHPEIVVSPYGEIYLVYSTFTQPATRMFKFDSGDWLEMSCPNSNGSFQKIYDFNSAGELIVVYYNAGALVARVFDGSNWNFLNLNIDINSSYTKYDLEVTVNGDIFVAAKVVDSTNYINLYQYQEDANDWDLLIEDIAGGHTSTVELASNSLGQLFILEEEYSVSQSSNVFQFSDDSLSLVGTLGYSYSARFSDIAVGADDALYVVYTDWGMSSTPIVVKKYDEFPIQTSVSEFTSEENFNIYPNPNYGQFQLEYELGARFTVIDINGQIVFNLNAHEAISGSEKLSVDLSHLDSGVYYVLMEKEDFKKVSSLVILEK